MRAKCAKVWIIPAILCLFSLAANSAQAAGVTINTFGGVAVSETGPTTDTYTIVLDAVPSAQVDITVSADADTVVSNGGPFSASVIVSFDNTDWFTPKTITVQAVDDPIAEGSPHTSTITHTASSTDAAYNGIAIANVTVNVTDNDFAGVTINTGGTVAVDETGPTTDTYTIVLDTPPTANVDITVTANADTEVSIDNVTFGSSRIFTFTNGTWNTPQVVYVRAIDDAIDETSPEATTITHTASSADAQYNGLVIANVSANVTDNDTAGVTINTGGTVAVDETGPTTDSYTFVLSSQPSSGSANIVVSEGSQVQVSKNGVNFFNSVTLNFTSGNWFVAQTVTVRAIDDFVDEAAVHTGTITHTASGSAEYVALNPLSGVAVDITDNDTAGVTVNPTTADVTEGGATDTYTIVLESQPTSSVTISFNTGTQVQGISNVIFTTANWNIAKTITVTAVDDGAVEGAHSGLIQHTATSGDANYNGIAVSDVTVNIADNDSYAVIVNPTTVNVTEGGATDTYTLVLGSQPSANVDIAFNTGTQVQPIATVTFTNANWNIPKTITVTAVDDGAAEGAHSGLIQHSAASGDGNYNGIGISNVTVNITDNDSYSVIVNPTTVNVTEGGATDTYTLVLGSQPSADVTISFNTGTQVQAIAGVTFTTGNWSIAKTITVAAVDDGAVEGAHSGLIQHSAASGDSNYNGIAISDVTVNITDNDSDLSITKDDGGVIAKPGQVIVYTLTYSSQGDATGVVIHETVPANTTFDAGSSDPGWSCADGSPAGTACDFSVGSVADGTAGTVLFAVKVDAAIPAGVVLITNTIVIDSGVADANPADNTAADTTPLVLSAQGVAVDPLGRFVVYTSTTPGCGFRVLVYQALDANGNPLGGTLQLNACGTVPEDVAGIDILKEKDTDNYWISFGGSLPSDSKFLLKIDHFGNILTPARAVVSASRFGSTVGATAIGDKGQKLYFWITGGGGAVYRTLIGKSDLLAGKVKKTSLITDNGLALQATQRTALPAFLALEKPVDILKAFSVNSKGLPDGTNWRLCPSTDGSHETGGISADGLFALSNSSTTPSDKLYALPLKSNGLPNGAPAVVASGAIASADVTNLLENGARFVVFTTDDGSLFLQVVNGTTGSKLGGPIPLN